MDAIGRLFKTPHDSFFLFGPRGTGKSTLLRADFPDALFGDLLDPDSYRTYVSRPEQLRAWIAYGRKERDMFFWRTKSGVEVDFVVYGQDTFLAIEVKSSRRVSSKDVRGLKAFREDYPQARACLLYGGRDRLLVEGIPCLPFGEFLPRLVPDASVSEILA